MNPWLHLFLISICLVGIRSFQQKNVMHDKYFTIVPTSYLFALCDITLVYHGLQSYVISIPMTVLCVGTGAWMGCWLSIFTHKRLHR